MITYFFEDRLRVISRVHPCDLFFQNLISIRTHTSVVLRTLEPEPDRVTTVVARTGSRPEQVRNQTVTQGSSVREDEKTRVLISSGDQEKSTEGNKCVTTPVTKDTARKVR